MVIQSSHCISPLNALIKETGLRTCILKADRLASDCQDIEEDSVSLSEELENLANFKISLCPPGSLGVESKQVLKLLKRIRISKSNSSDCCGRGTSCRGLVCTCIECKTLTVVN